MTVERSLPPVVSSPPSVTATLKRIAIFAATSWEVAAVRAAFPLGAERQVDGMRVHVGTVGCREYWLTRTGVGLEKASRAASQLLQHQPFSLVVSTGFACALVPAEIGDLLVGKDVSLVEAQGAEQSCAIDVPGAERDAMLAIAESLVPHDHVGRFVSADRIIGRAVDKNQVARTTGAIGLDMESAALAIEARHTQVSFVIVRAASDLLDEDLPLDFNLFLRPTGWLKGIAAVLGAPSSLLGLSRLRRQSQAAATQLTAFFKRYADVMASEDARDRMFTSRL